MARTKGTTQLNAEVTDKLLDTFKAFCEARRQSLRYHLELAMTRHMASPPAPPQPVELPPLAPMTDAAGAVATSGTAKRTAKGKKK